MKYCPSCGEKIDESVNTYCSEFAATARLFRGQGDIMAVLGSDVDEAYLFHCGKCDARCIVIEPDDSDSSIRKEYNNVLNSLGR